MATPNGAVVLRFGPFKLDSATGELFKEGAVVKLPPQPFRLLALLASRSGQLVTRQEIREALWCDGTTVEFDQSLNYCVRQLRAVLEDKARDARFIETLPKRGYRMIVPVETVGPAGPVQTNSVPADSMRQVKNPPVRDSVLDVNAAPPAVITHNIAHKAAASWRVRSVLAIAAAIAIAVALAARSGALHNAPEAPKAILVRPLVNLGLPEGESWFGDALAQQLIEKLAEDKALHVVPWSVAQALKDRGDGLGELGERFHVDAVLEGSVRYVGNRLHVSTELASVATERILWSHEDERDATDLGAVQDDIVSAVAGTLKFRLSEAPVPLARRRPQDRETYNLYLKAVVLGDQFSRQGAAESVEDFQEVIRRNPDYAPAYAGLANSLTILPFLQPVPPQQTLARAKDAAQRAIALDPELAAAHAALAHTYFNSWKWKESEKEFQTALSFDSDSAFALQLYGLFLGSQDRPEEAIRVARRAADLAPISSLTAYSLALVLFHAGRFDEAITEARRTLDLDPGFRQDYSVLVRAYTLKGMYPEAREALSEWQGNHLNPDIEQLLWGANLLARSGKRKEALRVLDHWAETSPRAANPSITFAAALVAAGERDRAFDAINRSIERHVLSMMWLKSTPELVAIRSDPRFAAAISKMASN